MAYPSFNKSYHETDPAVVKRLADEKRLEYHKRNGTGGGDAWFSIRGCIVLLVILALVIWGVSSLGGCGSSTPDAALAAKAALHRMGVPYGLEWDLLTCDERTPDHWLVTWRVTDPDLEHPSDFTLYMERVRSGRWKVEAGWGKDVEKR